MKDIERLRKIKMEHIEKIEKMELEEIKRISKIKLEELNRLEKLKLEEIEHLEQIKLSEMERLKKIKFAENERFKDIKNMKFLDIESQNFFIELILGELESFGEKEMVNLESIKQNEINRLEKIKNEEIEKHKNLLIKEIEYHKNLAKDEIERLKNIEKEELKYFKIIKDENIIIPKIEIEEIEVPYLNKVSMEKPLTDRRASPPLMNMGSIYQNDSNIRITFEENKIELNNEIIQFITIECSLKDKISILIEKYYQKIGNNSQKKLFFYENNELPFDLTVEEAHLYDCCKIKVINA